MKHLRFAAEVVIVLALISFVSLVVGCAGGEAEAAALRAEIESMRAAYDAELSDLETQRDAAIETGNTERAEDIGTAIQLNESLSSELEKQAARLEVFVDEQGNVDGSAVIREIGYTLGPYGILGSGLGIALWKWAQARNGLNSIASGMKALRSRSPEVKTAMKQHRGVLDGAFTTHAKRIIEKVEP